MKNSDFPGQPYAKSLMNPLRGLALVLCSAVLILAAGCGTSKSEKKKNDFFTSGSREADQRASQRMAKSEQLSGSGESSGDKKTKKAETPESSGGTGKAAQAEGKMTLFERLGGENGITAIIDDFLPRALQDPRVNWNRKGIKSGGLFNREAKNAPMWNPTPEHITTLKKHLIQFVALATGGPAQYEGDEMKSTHQDMKISNPEFDAAVGDLKASLDKLQIPDKEQKELLAIIESTRPQIVTQR